MLVSENTSASETKSKSESEVKKMVTEEDKMARRDSKSENIEGNPKNNVPEELHHLKCN